jgi:hypothetical protein
MFSTAAISLNIFDPQLFESAKAEPMDMEGRHYCVSVSAYFPLLTHFYKYLVICIYMQVSVYIYVCMCVCVCVYVLGHC